MANHVNSNIEFDNISEEASKFLLSLPTDNEEILGKIFPDYKPEGEWYIENIGSKWITFDDIYDVTLNITTAWIAPYSFYNGLYEKLQSLSSPDLEMWVTYDDEMPNFVGVFGRIDDYEYEDCIEEEHYKAVFGITASNEEKEEFDEEWWDRVHEFYADEYSAFKECYEQTKEIQETP
jgi:hypothetical protein